LITSSATTTRSIASSTVDSNKIDRILYIGHIVRQYQQNKRQQQERDRSTAAAIDRSTDSREIDLQPHLDSKEIDRQHQQQQQQQQQDQRIIPYLQQQQD
jgi:uncharacterized membrane protein YkoI